MSPILVRRLWLSIIIVEVARCVAMSSQTKIKWPNFRQVLSTGGNGKIQVIVPTCYMSYECADFLNLINKKVRSSMFGLDVQRCFLDV